MLFPRRPSPLADSDGWPHLAPLPDRSRVLGPWSRAVGFIRDALVVLVIAVLVSYAVKTFLVRSFFIPSASMSSTLEIDDRILVNELHPHPFGLERGDIVVFSDPGGWLSSIPAGHENVIDWALSFVGLTAPDSDQHLVKRVIGLPGDHLLCCNPLGQLEINGVPIEEPYLRDPTAGASETEFDVTVPDGALWVMGDNRKNSADSRSHVDQPGGGFVPLANVVGRAFLISWPPAEIAVIERPFSVFDGVPDHEGTP